MFGVSKFEDLNYIIMGYMFSQNDDEVCGIMDRFKVCANKKFDNDNTDWVRLIRFYSASDSHSLELFKIVLDEMLDGDLN